MFTSPFQKSHLPSDLQRRPHWSQYVITKKKKIHTKTYLTYSSRRRETSSSLSNNKRRITWNNRPFCENEWNVCSIFSEICPLGFTKRKAVSYPSPFLIFPLSKIKPYEFSVCDFCICSSIYNGHRLHLSAAYPKNPLVRHYTRVFRTTDDVKPVSRGAFWPRTKWTHVRSSKYGLCGFKTTRWNRFWST